MSRNRAAEEGRRAARPTAPRRPGGEAVNLDDYWSTTDKEISRLRAEVERLKAERDRYREALEFYANPDNWRETVSHESKVAQDGLWYRAYAATEPKPAPAPSTVIPRPDECSRCQDIARIAAALFRARAEAIGRRAHEYAAVIRALAAQKED